jgi:hypothetical protein
MYSHFYGIIIHIRDFYKRLTMYKVSLSRLDKKKGYEGNVE